MDQESRSLIRWQRRLLPLMMSMLVGASLFFFIATAWQLWSLNAGIRDSPQLPVEQLLRPANCAPSQSAEACLAQRKFDTSAILEAHTLGHRYHQAMHVVASSIWSRYLGFVTGMTLALIGAAFILGKIDVKESTAEGKFGDWGASLRTTSPGLVLCALGTILMVVAITTLHTFKAEDRALFVTGELPPVDLSAPKPASTPK